MFLYAQSIVNKFYEFESFIRIHQTKVIRITETWCSVDILDGYFSLPGHHAPFRKDRLQGKGGDVLLLVHESLDVAPCDDLSNSNFGDSVLCKIRLLKNDSLLIGVIII